MLNCVFTLYTLRRLLCIKMHIGACIQLAASRDVQCFVYVGYCSLCQGAHLSCSILAFIIHNFPRRHGRSQTQAQVLEMYGK